MNTLLIFLGLGIFIAIYFLIITEKLPNTFSALLGGFLMIAVHILGEEEAFDAIDWEVIFLLTGMMIIVHITSETGLFQWIAIKLAQAVKGEPFPIMVLLVLVTAVFSALLDNVTTVLLIAPVSILLAEQLKINPIPFLIAEALASNLGGTATLIGDPPNILIGMAADLTFNEFLVHLAPFVLINLIVFVPTLWFLFGKTLHVSRDLKAKIMDLEADRALKDLQSLKQSLTVLGLVILGFLTHEWTGLGPATLAFGGAVVLAILTKKTPEEIFHPVEWRTLFFFMGLFIMVAGIVKIGAIEVLARGALTLTKSDLQLTSFFVLWLSGIVSAVVDNIPYTATLIPMIGGSGGLIENIHHLHPELGLEAIRYALWWALALGACLGGNGTLVGASANVVIANIASKSGKPISFMEFTKYGVLIMFQSLILSSVYLWLRYLH
jgi:Na+/H+ antiporter NhaD/arsenite permease-like protein